MSDHKVIYEIPEPGDYSDNEAIIYDNEIRYDYARDGVHFRSGLRFYNVKATRTRSESASKTWHIKDSYYTLIEIENSNWIKEILLDTEESRRQGGDVWELHHYMIYLEGPGCVEMMASSWEVIDEEPGSWT